MGHKALVGMAVTAVLVASFKIAIPDFPFIVAMLIGVVVGMVAAFV